MSSHGGKREGAGRPSLLDTEKRKTVSITLPIDLVDELDEKANSILGMNRSRLIEQVLMAGLGRV